MILFYSRRSLSTALLVVFLLSGCVPDAPRDNPYDPLGENKGVIGGWVFSFYEPRQPLEMVRVSLEPSGRVEITDSQGRFAFPGATPGSYRLVAEKTGYRPDTLTVTLQAEENSDNRNLFLNGLPNVESSRFYSRHVDQVFPGEFYEAVFEITVSDPDGAADVRQVFFNIPGLGYQKSFASNGGPGSFLLTIEDTELLVALGGNLYLLAENESYLVLEDQSGARNTVGPFALQRIIDEAPVPLYPAISDTTAARPDFRWEHPGVRFDYTFFIEIRRLVGGTFRLQDNIEGIAGDALSFRYPADLPAGVYTWALGLKDNFGNSTRSREVPFVVNP